MSTRINVTVGDGGLLDRNAQQTAANRQARVLADQRATAETQGVERRAADRTTAGLDPLTGLPAATPSSSSAASFSSGIRRLDQEPAANRRQQEQGTSYVLYFPSINTVDVPVLGDPGNFSTYHVGKLVKLPNRFTNIYEDLFPVYGVSNRVLEELGPAAPQRATLRFIEAGGPFGEPAVAVNYRAAIFVGVDEEIPIFAVTDSRRSRKFTIQENTERGVTVETDCRVLRDASFGVQLDLSVNGPPFVSGTFAASMNINTGGSTVTFRNNIVINFPFTQKILTGNWVRLGCTITPENVFYFFDGKLLYTEPVFSTPTQEFFIFSGTRHQFLINGQPAQGEITAETVGLFNSSSHQKSCTRLITSPVYTRNYTPKSLLARP